MDGQLSGPEASDRTEPSGQDGRQFVVDLLIAEEAARRQAAWAADALKQAENERDALGKMLEAVTVEMLAELDQAINAIQRAEVEAISRFATWISARRTLIGLLRRSSTRAASALRDALHAYQVPERATDMDWLQNKRVLLGLLRRSLDGPGTTQSVVFTQMARYFFRR